MGKTLVCIEAEPAEKVGLCKTSFRAGCLGNPRCVLCLCDIVTISKTSRGSLNFQEAHAKY